MTTDAALNVGQVLREGARLTTAEAIAVVYAVLTEVSRGAALAVPRQSDEVWITEAGAVRIAPPATVEAPRAAVAALLEELLPSASDEPGDPVPKALRTLPSRLREAGDRANDGLSQLLLILSRYLSSNPSDLLRQFVGRMRKGSAVTDDILPRMAIAESVPIVESGATAKRVKSVANDQRVKSSAIDQSLKSEANDQRVKSGASDQRRVLVDSSVGGNRAASAGRNTVVDRQMRDLPLHVDRPPLTDRPSSPMPDRHFASQMRDPHLAANRVPLIALSLLLIALAGFLGYRLTLRSNESTVAASDPVAPAAVEPRIVERDRPPANLPVAPERPTPLILPVADGAFSPSFAADGTLLFHAGRNSRGQLFTATVDLQGAATAQPLMSDQARNYHPRLSPDGTRLAFDSDREGERAVYVAERNGEGVTRVSGRGYAAVPSWSPDGTRLAFIKAEPDQPRVWNLWLLNLTTGELRRHTTFLNGQVWGASWFPDGRRLAYSHEDRLIVSDLQSASHDVYRSPVKGHLVRTPAVSPDGRRIVFQVYRDGVWMLDLTTGATDRVLDDVSAEEFAWDPDGQRIAYHSRRDGEWRIWLMRS